MPRDFIRAQTLDVRRKVHQNDGDGLCFSACIASLMGLRLEDVPCFWDDDRGDSRRADMSDSAKAWLKSQGYVYWELRWDGELGCQHEPCPCILSGRSPRGIMHAVVGEFFIIDDGDMKGHHGVQMIHDPHPSKAGIKEVEWIGFLLPTRITPSPAEQGDK